MITLLLSFIPLALFSVLAFWKPNAVLFMISAGIAMFVGFYWFDAYTTNLGMAISLCIIAYALYCIGLAFRMIFWNRGKGSEEE